MTLPLVVRRFTATILIPCAAVLTLAGCWERSALEAKVARDRAPLQRHGGAATNPVQVFIDPDTGCHYLTAYRYGITPRLAGDGKQLCILGDQP